MKKLIFTWLCMCILQLLHAQDESYRGGSADGHAMQAMVTPFANPNSFQPFKGGNADGHGTDSLIAFPQHGPANLYSPFRGGMADGHAADSMITFAQYAYITMFAPFSGGMADGYAADSLIAFNQHGYINMYQPFSGGQADGWTSYPVFGITVLPVQLIAFTGEQQNKIHLLRWATSQEINTAKFELERSTDGRSFAKIATVASNGNTTNRSNYQQRDATPAEGNNFYRLKMIDNDGSFTYSNIILLKQVGTAIAMSIYPNPATRSLNISLGGIADNSNVSMAVYDVNGRQVKAIRWKKSGNSYSLNVDQLSAGVYILQVIQNGGVTIWRFVKN